MTNTSEWKYIGTQGVDSGGVIITDPSYMSDFKTEEDFDITTPNNEFSENGYAYTTINKFGGELKNDIGATLGVCSRSGIGDGGYDVYIKTAKLEDWGERVVEMKIVFIEEDER